MNYQEFMEKAINEGNMIKTEFTFTPGINDALRDCKKLSKEIMKMVSDSETKIRKNKSDLELI